jgi:hypothetical protein
MNEVTRDHEALLRLYLLESLGGDECSKVTLERRLAGLRALKALRPLSEAPEALYVAALDPYDPSWCSPDWELRGFPEGLESVAAGSPEPVEETSLVVSAKEGVAETCRSALTAGAKHIAPSEPMSPVVLTFPEPPGHAAAASTSAPHGPPAVIAALGELAAA